MHDIDIPTLLLASEIHPALAYVTVAAVIAMIYSTAVGMFFAFAARWAEPNTNKFKVIAIISTVIGIWLSEYGFGRLVGSVYPLMGVLGVVIVIAILWYWIKTRKTA